MLLVAGLRFGYSASFGQISARLIRPVGTRERRMLGAVGLSEREPEEARKLAVWAKGHIIPGQDEATWRADAFGSVMRFHDYGNRSSEHGWEIDHYPIPRGFDGLDTMPNARPLHWRNNASHRGALRRVAGIRATTAGRRATGP